ncbi:MAG TPA: topoisomerase DNA-binding C4 zinc finger domain-containing protein [bacterium]
MDQTVMENAWRNQLFHQFYRDWYTLNIPKLAVQFRVSEDTLKKDFLSDEFRHWLIEKTGVDHITYAVFSKQEPISELFLSEINTASLSTDNRLHALSATLSAINRYVSAMRESVLIDSRFRIEGFLVSRDGMPTGKICEDCGAPMHIVSRVYGDYFAGCSKYPECYNLQTLSTEDFMAAPRRIDQMNEGDLDEVLSRLQPSADNWLPNSYDEPATKSEFIDPILMSLGWDTYGGSNVGREVKTGEGLADYVLFTEDGEPLIVVEAKKLQTKLMNHTEQLAFYMSGLRTKLGILTNGLDWEVYELKDYGHIMKILSLQNIYKIADEQLIADFRKLIGRREPCLEDENDDPVAHT